MRGLKGKNALVTGGASGIGQATATRFMEEGCGVVCAEHCDDLFFPSNQRDSILEYFTVTDYRYWLVRGVAIWSWFTIRY